MNFGQAIEQLKKGQLIFREGWNEKDVFVFKQISAFIGPDVIPKMQSVPQLAKEIVMKRDSPALNYSNQMGIVHSDGRVNSWVPSSSDIFSEDWKLYNSTSHLPKN